MLKVLLVDDEPFITQGLSVLLDWNQQGFEIVGTAANGSEALKFLKDTEVDLILADIKMPVMSGIELLKKIREERLSDAFFVIMSGYSDFAYAKEAIHYKCSEYMLKPIQKSQLVELLQKISALYEKNQQEKIEKTRMGMAYFARSMQSLLLGHLETESIEELIKKLPLAGKARYINIEVDDTDSEKRLNSEEKRRIQRQIYINCMDFLGENRQMLCFLDAMGQEDTYDVGMVYFRRMAEERNLSEAEYLEQLYDYLQKGEEFPIAIYVGNKVENICELSESFRTAMVAKSVQNFRINSNILFYEEQKRSTFSVVSKEHMDQLLRAIEQNEDQQMTESATEIYREMNECGMDPELIKMNMNYLLLQLVHLAMEQDESINQEEILSYIRENAFDRKMIRGSVIHFIRFIRDYSDYLCQLRKKVSRGVLAEVEEEIKLHYAENLTLKDLSKKYYVNSAYLGQLFRKQYGISFKDYLNQYRIEKATEILIRTDDKVYNVAGEVGYRDLDYFINKFILAKGCTPTSYRKKMRQ